MGRFIVLAGVIVVLALAAPWVAPSLMARWLHVETPAETAAEESAPGKIVAVARAPEVRAERPAEIGGDHVSIDADAEGHFVVDAQVNGRAVSAMIDTGATTVAISEKPARRLGIIPRRDQFTRPVSTANGVVKAAPIMLSEIRIGSVTVRNVPAIVVPGEEFAVDLFGMSFLQRLARYEATGRSLVLVE